MGKIVSWLVIGLIAAATVGGLLPEKSEEEIDLEMLQLKIRRECRDFQKRVGPYASSTTAEMSAACAVLDY